MTRVFDVERTFASLESDWIERGTWHTASGEPAARMLFITDGEGTRHRPVD